MSDIFFIYRERVCDAPIDVVDITGAATYYRHMGGCMGQEPSRSLPHWASMLVNSLNSTANMVDAGNEFGFWRRDWFA
jgi:hypothetical protein